MSSEKLAHARQVAVKLGSRGPTSHGVTWSPDSRGLALARDEHGRGLLEIVDARTDETRRIASTDGRFLHA